MAYDEDKLKQQLYGLCLIFYDTPDEIGKISNLTTIQECLDFLRLAIQYQMLDIEATRRERDVKKDT